MNIKNYTSQVPVGTSMNKIEKCLVETGASDISKKYKDGICTAISFRMLVRGEIPMFFQLPAQVGECYNILWKEVKKPQPGTQQRIREQAERTAWKLISDWVEIQLSMIQLKQAEPLQVFLPYVYDPATDQTFYQKLQEGKFKLLN